MSSVGGCSRSNLRVSDGNGEYIENEGGRGWGTADPQKPYTAMTDLMTNIHRFLDLCPTVDSMMLPRARHRSLSLWVYPSMPPKIPNGTFDGIQLPSALNWCTV
jgi:hypothetical protein